MKPNLHRIVRRKLAGISFVEMDSPLKYSTNARRLALCDSKYDDDPTTEKYFDEGDPCVVAFLDWTEYGGDSIHLYYMNTRDDARRQRYATALIEEFYRRHADKVKPSTVKGGYTYPGGTMHWGKLMHKGTEKLFRKMDKKYPDIYHKGKFGWAG